MANWSDLKASVAKVIKTNGNQEITGQILQNTLNSIISNLGENATFAGIATPTTNPGAPDGNVFYIASEGAYPNFGAQTVETGQIATFTWKDNKWAKQTIEIGSAGGNFILDWSENKQTTRLQVLSKYRKAGLMIAYNNPTDGWINEQYIGTLITDTEWQKDKNWEKIVDESRLNIALNSTININDIPSSTVKPLRVISGYVVQEDGNLRAAGACIACFDVQDAFLLKFSKQRPSMFISNSVGYIIFRKDGTFITGTYSLTDAEVSISIPDNSLSLGLYVINTYNSVDTDFMLYYFSKKNKEDANIEAVIKENTEVSTGYYNKSTGVLTTAYTNFASLITDIAAGTKKISFPIAASELSPTGEKNTNAASVVFFNSTGAMISSVFYGFCSNGVKAYLDVPNNATRVAVSYLSDTYCKSNSIKTFSELGGLKMLADVSYVEDIKKRIDYASAALGIYDAPSNLLPSEYTKDFIRRDYVNTDIANIDYSYSRFNYPALISGNIYATALSVKFYVYKSGLTIKDVMYVCYEAYVNSEGNATLHVQFTDNSYNNITINYKAGYNTISQNVYKSNLEGKTIKIVQISLPTNTDVLGHVYIGAELPYNNIYGANDVYFDFVRRIMPNILERTKEISYFSNLAPSLESLAVDNRTSSPIQVQYLEIVPKRFDNKKYVIVTKTVGARRSGLAVFNFYENEDAVIYKNTLNASSDDPAISTSYYTTIREDNIVTTINAVLFEIKEDYLGKIQISNNNYSASELVSYTGIWVMPVPDYFNKPSDIFEYIDVENLMANVSANSINSVYSVSTGVFKGKKLVGLGDSIMAQATYLPTLIRKTGMYLSKKIAAGGAHVRPNGDNNCIFFFADDVPENIDAILIIAGQNDVGIIGNVEKLGTINDTPYLEEENAEGVCTFVSAYKGMLIKLIQKNPLAKIIACGLLPTWTLTAEGMEAYTKKKLILNDLIRDICNLYGVQFIDLIRNVGINWYNATYMFNHDGGGVDGGPSSDDDGQVHPSQYGGEKCAEYIISQII